MPITLQHTAVLQGGYCSVYHCPAWQRHTSDTETGLQNITRLLLRLNPSRTVDRTVGWLAGQSKTAVRTQSGVKLWRYSSRLLPSAFTRLRQTDTDVPFKAILSWSAASFEPRLHRRIIGLLQYVKKNWWSTSPFDVSRCID